MENIIIIIIINMLGMAILVAKILIQVLVQVDEVYNDMMITIRVNPGHNVHYE